MLVSLIRKRNPETGRNEFEFREGIHRYQSGTSFYEVNSEAFKFKQIKELMINYKVKGKVLSNDAVKQFIFHPDLKIKL